MDRDEHGFIAMSGEPWLLIDEPRMARFAGAMVSITYRSSFWDVPARPLFRFLQGTERLSDAIGPAPLEAAAIWTGRVPAGTTDIHVSPTNHPGSFDFRIESLRRRSWPLLAIEGLGRARGPGRSAVLTRLIGWRPEADSNLAWAIGAYPLDGYEAWARSRRRSFDLAGIDHMPPCAGETEQVRIVVPPQPAASLERSLASLRDQSLERWQALVIGTPPPSMSGDPRMTSIAAADAAAMLIQSSLWFTVLPAGGTLEPTALASIAVRRARDPESRLIYGDEIVGGQPSLKPGWSPRLASALPCLGRAVFASPANFAPGDIRALVDGGEWLVPAGVTPLPLRRILLRRLTPTSAPEPVSSPAPACATVRTAIIVPTRDQPAMLARLVASIRAHSDPNSYRIVVVDNGDVGGPASSVLAELAAARDTIVLSRPGAFNFSGLCNEAARATPEPMLLFLNDDMEILSDDWLERLAGHASAPGVGAVGAKLTYPDGRLQHIGVLAGMGGSAGHFGAPAPGDDAGWAGRNHVLHEVSAVTGACLAVLRAKFEAVGGFDEVHLPVELSDIDLCFKLNARGWQTLIDPAVHLLHEESFSRGGATFRRLSKYADQRATFLDRWRHVLRDDPVFHPALSLYSWRAALG